MAGFRYKPGWLALIAAALLAPTASPACNVPVFRYALEQWTPDRSLAVVFHKEPFTPEAQELVEAMEKTDADGLANLQVRQVEVSGEMSAPFQALWKAQVHPSLPWMVVRYPGRTGIEPPVWSGPLSAETVRALVDSPARRDIASRLLKGDTAVWLLLESGDQKQDDAVARTVETESRNLERTLQLPELNSDDPPLVADLPVRIAFSVVRVARSDPAERLLVNQLLNWHPDLARIAEPMLFPIFGRGRVLPPAIGAAIQPQSLAQMASFVTGPCSCEIKEQNPGFDLLIAANWDSLFDGREQKFPKLPPLIGLSQLAAHVEPNLKATFPLLPASLALEGAHRSNTARDHLLRNLVVVFAMGVVLLTVTTLVLRARANRRAALK